MKRRFFIQTLILSSGYAMLSAKGVKGMHLDDDTFKIVMIYNNTGESAIMKSEWGLSIWIEKKNSATLFDTGGNASVLWENISHTDLDIGKLSTIVISHNHWDHKNGLNLILEKTSYKSMVYVVENDYKEYKEKFPNANIKSVSGTSPIDTDMWISGQLLASFRGTELYEQSVILTQKESIVLLTGCSHSGIVNMVKTIKNTFPNKHMELVAGGFHLIDQPDNEIMKISNELKELNINKIAPSHCTGDPAINLFKKDWGERFIDFNLGYQLSI